MDPKDLPRTQQGFGQMVGEYWPRVQKHHENNFLSSNYKFMEISCLWCVHKPVILKSLFNCIPVCYGYSDWIISMYNDCVGKTSWPLYIANTMQSCQVEGLTAVLLKIQIWVPWNVNSCQKHKQRTNILYSNLWICVNQMHTAVSEKSLFNYTPHPANCKQYSLQRILSCEICHHSQGVTCQQFGETTNFTFKKSSTLHIEAAGSSEILVNF